MTETDKIRGFNYAERHATWEEIPEYLIVGDPDENLQEQSCIIWWRRNAKDCFLWHCPNLLSN